MPHLDLVRSVPLPDSFRVARVQGMFDLPARATVEWRLVLDVPLDDFGEWTVGAIVGGSGAGKSTVAAELFGRVWLPGMLDWSDRPLVDDFPASASVGDVVGALTSVGLSSPPIWLRPYRVLSVGEQFRATVARLLLAADDPLVLDEFTSVVDRTVARATATAVGRLARQRKRRMVAVACHKDIISWLAPDWVLDLDDGRFFRWGRPGRRPGLVLRVYPGGREAWPRFARYHYLTGELVRHARIFLATVEFPDDDGGERLCGFFAVVQAQGVPGWVRGHRTVVLPDFQGLGIGNALIEHTAEWLWEHERKRFRATTSAPAIVAHRRRHPECWRLTLPPTDHLPSGSGRQTQTATGRLTTAWEYVPAALRAALPAGTRSLTASSRSGRNRLLTVLARR